jgi:ribonuclease HI
MNNKIIIYTDGGCRGNPGIGGWGVFLSFQGKEKKIYGSEKETTNNRMELTAAIKALECIKKDIPIIIYTDSKYVLEGITKWIFGWKKKNWKKVKNIDLWQQLDILNQKFNVDWQWVKGHSGNAGNDIADALANQAMDAL